MQKVSQIESILDIAEWILWNVNQNEQSKKKVTIIVSAAQFRD